MIVPAVVQVASSYAPNIGGVETLAGQVARRYPGFMRVVTNRWPPDLAERETLDGVEVLRTGFPLPGGTLRSTARWALDARSTGRRLTAALDGVDLVHVQCAGPNTAYAVQAARAAGLPLVVSLHGELTMDETGAYRLAAMRRAWRLAMARAAVVTACSQAVLDDALAAYGPGLAERIEVLPNAVDVAAVRAAQPAVRSRPFLLAAARLVPHKGLDLLIDAFATLAAEHPDLDLVLAGDGPLRTELVRQAQALGVAHRVELAGALEAAEVFGLMRSARVFVLPSRREPQGLVLLEAMAAGAPVVATRVDGVPESVEDGVTGLLVAPDAGALAAGLRAALDDGTAADARAHRAGEAVAGRTWDRYVQRLSGCYQAAAGVR